MSTNTVHMEVIIPSWGAERVANALESMQEGAEVGAVMQNATGQPLCVSYTIVCPDVTESALLDEGSPIRGRSHLRFTMESTEGPVLPVTAMHCGSTGVNGGLPDLLAFLHDDVTIEQTFWAGDVFRHFDTNSRCGLAGFGGGLGFADRDIYKTPYRLQQLPRHDFISNMREAESHGRRVTVPTRVAALDGFSLIIRRELYEQCGGWEQCLKDGIPFHMYDAWISCMAARYDWETWMLPIACHHAGGSTSVLMAEQYERCVKELGYRDGQELYDDAHRRIYDLFRDVLPILSS